MPSSISSSDVGSAAGPRHALSPGLRLTASDRPGVAQPVPERDIPDRPWRAISLAAFLIVAILTSLWEVRMRQLGLTPGDLGDNASAWAEQRRRIDSEPIKVAIVGDSRILFDTDLSRFQQLTGVRPLQLALPGTNGRPVLEDLAADPKFKGLVIVGMADTSYFRDKIGFMKQALDLGHWESPAKRGSFVIHRFLAQHLAFLETEYRLSTLVARTDPNWRAGVEGPYNDVWKIGQSFGDRQTFMWPRIEQDERLRQHALAAWGGFRGPPVKPAIIAMTQAKTRAAVDTIRARGGDVIFVRPPSIPEIRANEEKRIPKARGWDALLTTSHSAGIHIDDLPAAQGLVIPEGSHVSRACATVFTDAYVRRLVTLMPRLHLMANAPAPLSARDCRPRTAG
ncbi:hypothetical protein [Sphingomonas sp. YR710]|uniref:hypothetical protein n=1 Tax=Sphingomonas sp. YR710 TaxID=1882773 RepID=UPI00115F7CA9|nr:hypothetical protein [Sphingomonas sp. YR710]